MFFNWTSLTSVDLSGLDTSGVEDMSGMFQGCDRLTTLDLSMFDTSNVKSMDRMFTLCSGLTSLDLSKFDTPTWRRTEERERGLQERSKS